MHINVLKFRFFSPIFISLWLLHSIQYTHTPIPHVSNEKETYKRWNRRNVKKILLLLLLLWSNDPHQHLSRDIQMGFPSFFRAHSLLFSPFFPYSLQCKHLSGYISIVCISGFVSMREKEQQQQSLFLLKNGICYALIKCCLVHLLLFYHQLFTLLKKTFNVHLAFKPGCTSWWDKNQRRVDE